MFTLIGVKSISDDTESTNLEIIANRANSQMSRVLAYGPGDRGTIPGRVIPKTQKMVRDTTLLNVQHYKVRVKWSNSGNGVASSTTHWCSSYRVTLN